MNITNPQTGPTLSVAEELLTRKKRTELLKLMSHLSVVDRDILVMKFIQGNSNEEIAINTGLFRKNVEDRIDQALKKLNLT